MRVILLLVFAWNFIYANSTIHFEKGWSLVGVPTTLTNLEIFQGENVEIVWGFDAKEQKWQGYSADTLISTKIHDNNFSTLSSLQPYQAVWVLSKESWGFEIPTASINEPTNNTIVLKSGWNLLTLPNKAIVYKDFFGDALVWKYDTNWSVNDSSLNFPTITNLKESEGFWVYSKEDSVVDMGEKLSKLSTFSSHETMLSYLREMVKSNSYRYGYVPFVGGVAVAENTQAPTVATDNTKNTTVDATTTNLQEVNVDESDILKHDGTYIFSVDNTKQQIFITSFENITNKNYEAINTLSTVEQGFVQALYLQNNRLIVISNNVIYSMATISQRLFIPFMNNNTTQIAIYDTSDIKNLRLLSSHTIDGNYEDSRLIDAKLFFITKFYPQVEYDYPKIYVDTLCSTLDFNQIYASCTASTEPSIMPVDDGFIKDTCTYGTDYKAYQDNECYIYNYDADKKAWKYDYENPTIKSENLTPNILSNGVTSSLVEPSKFYAPQKLDQNLAITTISSFDVASGTHEESISFLGNTSTYYASTTSLYLVSNEYPLYYNFYDFSQRQMVYKFALNGTLSYKGRGFVDGVMLSQFSMSEKDEYLRVATTNGNSWSGGGTQNSLFTLKENNELLEVKATLSNLGKEGERIMGVRFMGDRGFIVTFKQTDPLYTLDLSDPLSPKAVGELSIPGFSSYLHVVDENRVLSIGRDADTQSGRTLGLQLQLFDITDFSNPLLADKVSIGSNSTYSPAEYNHKAFAYRASDLMFGLPYTEYIQTNSSENFGIYQINGMKINSLHTITQTVGDYSWGNEKRGLIFDLNNTTYGTLFEGSNLVSDTILKGN